ncbi:MAG: NAD(P)-dependent oxidoreductase [Clostridiales bacterium]|nr:NAD(P)-dependent oxidoreductase [Clostridiales bacterium]
MIFLVAGACGFIGTEFTQYARSKGHTVKGCDVFRWEEKAKELFPVQSDYWCILDEPEDVFFDKADSIVLLAAKRPYNGFCSEDYLFNIRTSDDYISLAIKHQIPNAVFASSKAVYSGENQPWKEDDLTRPSSLYGASKSAVEQLGLYYSSAGSINFVALRFAQVIGMGERKGYLINTLIDNAVAGKQQILFGDGSQYRHYVYIKDLCEAIVLAGSLKHSGIYNIGMKTSTTNLELAQAVNSAFGNEGNITHDYSKPMASNNDVMDINKASEELGFNALFDVNSAMKDIALGMRMNGTDA